MIPVPNQLALQMTDIEMAGVVVLGSLVLTFLFLIAMPGSDQQDAATEEAAEADEEAEQEMIECPRCRTETDVTAKFCSECGKDLT